MKCSGDQNKDGGSKNQQQALLNQSLQFYSRRDFYGRADGKTGAEDCLHDLLPQHLAHTRTTSSAIITPSDVVKGKIHAKKL